MSKTIDQLIEIIMAGGVIKLDIKSRPFSHILKLAEKASLGGGGIIFQNSELRTTKQLIELSSFNSHKNIQFEIN
jgi:hypothetical protein